MVSHYQDTPTLCFHDTTLIIINDFLVPNDFEYYDADGGAGTWSNQDLKECIENSDPEYHGVGIINYFGHGDTAYWERWNNEEDFTTNNVHNLCNTNYYPIVYNACCWNGAIQGEIEAMVEAWIRDPDGGGVGTLGASFLQNAAENYGGANHIPVDLFRATFGLGIYKVGWAINYAKDRLVEEEDPEGLALQNARMFNWFGDPELSIWTCVSPCSTMNVSHPTNIIIGQQNFTVTVINPESGPVQYALVCLYKEDEDPELWQTKHTNSNGQATFRINPCYGGVLYVTVTKHNYAPYEGECTVWPAGGGGPQDAITIPQNLVFGLKVLPNIIRHNTQLQYTIPEKQKISLSLCDVVGQKVVSIADGAIEPGIYTYNLEPFNLSQGIYFLILEGEKETKKQKLLIVR